MFLRRGISLAKTVYPHFISKTSAICYNAAATVLHTDRSAPVAYYSIDCCLSPLLPSEAEPPQSGSYDIDLVDDDAWRVSSGLALAEGTTSRPSCLSDTLVDDDPVGKCSPPFEGEPDYDDIEDMRIRGKLFYKIDRDSKEFEEYSFEFHRRNKSSEKMDGPKESKRKDTSFKDSKKENPIPKFSSRTEKQGRIVDNSRPGELDKGIVEKKKLRTPTYNQLTGPYHEPFCLDIYISKASVRACIIHRATSKVVAVAHSISKDMKFDLDSTRNATACAAVGEVLAQRALGDDIHDVIYTPRRGEKLEGKLQIVLQSLLDNGVNVKVKIKQRNRRKHSSSPRPTWSFK